MERVSKLVNNIYAQNGSMILNDGEIMVSGEIPQTIPTQYCYELFRPLTAEDIQRVADWCCTIKVDIGNSKGQYIEKDEQEATEDGSESTKIQHGI